MFDTLDVITVAILSHSVLFIVYNQHTCLPKCTIHFLYLLSASKPKCCSQNSPNATEIRPCFLGGIMNLYNNIGSIKTLFPEKGQFGGPAPSHDLLPMFCIWRSTSNHPSFNPSWIKDFTHFVAQKPSITGVLVEFQQQNVGILSTPLKFNMEPGNDGFQ